MLTKDQILGEYRIVRLLGKGGMGSIYEAVQIKLDRRVAIKVLDRNLSDNPIYVARFRREARSAAALNHPRIIHIYDIEEIDGDLFIAMELVDGMNLSDRLKHLGKLSIPATLHIAKQVVDALTYAQQQGIIHRDIKPDNLILTMNGQVKLADLGLSKHLEKSINLTDTGIGIGSPYFMAPEQARNAKEVDHRADMYSLGVTLLYLLTGCYPFTGSSAYDVVIEHATKPLPTGAALGTALPADVESFIQRLAAKQPENRFPDYASLLEYMNFLLQAYPFNTVNELEIDSTSADNPDNQTTRGPGLKFTKPSATAYKAESAALPLAANPSSSSSPAHQSNELSEVMEVDQAGNHGITLKRMALTMFAAIGLIAVGAALSFLSLHKPRQRSTTASPSAPVNTQVTHSIDHATSTNAAPILDEQPDISSSFPREFPPPSLSPMEGEGQRPHDGPRPAAKGNGKRPRQDSRPPRPSPRVEHFMQTRLAAASSRDEMIKLVTDYENKNPTSYGEIIMLYHYLQSQAGPTHHDEWTAKIAAIEGQWDHDATDEFIKRKGQMVDLLTQKDYISARELWLSFPQNLKNRRIAHDIDAMLRAVDEAEFHR